MFNPSREQARRFLIETLAKKRSRALMTPLETVAAEWLVLHPEYFSAFESGDEDALRKDYTPEGGAPNPFLHVSMHLSITEQVSIDQPAGIAAAVNALATRLGSLHDAHHAVMECLADMLWNAQRTNTPPDGAAYVACVERRAGLK